RPRGISNTEAAKRKRVSAQPEEKLLPSPRTQQTRWKEVLDTAYRRRTIIVWTLWTTAFFVTNSLNNWLPSLYSTVYHLGLRQSLRAASMTNVAQVAVLLICVFVIDRIGRRTWTLASLVIGAGALLTLGWIGATSVRSV